MNECEVSNGGCDQLCNNTQGNYTCSCRDGFILASDGQKCNDIDECQSPTECSHICVNNPGSFECQCHNGYSLSADGYSCQGEKLLCQLYLYNMICLMSIILIDVDECLESNGGCDHNCTNSEGSFQCSCRSGYHLAVDNLNCLDIDECESNPCQHTCNNLDGGYRCECPQGYALDSDGFRCKGIYKQTKSLHPIHKFYSPDFLKSYL